jgi:DNA-binding HxlR family transcriptional regulator
MSADDRKIAERMLMTELKELDKENWVNVEVFLSPILTASFICARC